MSKFCVFGGTTEGREIIEFLCAQGVPVTACVATEYGGSLLEPGRGLTVLSGKLDEEGMRELFRRERFDLVIDATHPYARLATDNIAAAAAETGTGYLRLLREASAEDGEAVCVPDAESAAAYLDGTE